MFKEKDISKALFRDKNNNYLLTEYTGDGNEISFFNIEEKEILANIEIYADKIK